MPFKANRDRRHHIPKQRHRVINWAAYDAGLRARGSLTVWFTPEAIAAWRAEPRTGRAPGLVRFTSCPRLGACAGNTQRFNFKDVGSARFPRE